MPTSTPSIPQETNSSTGKIIIVTIGFLVFGGVCAVGGYILASTKNTTVQQANTMIHSSSSITPTPITSITSTPTPSVTAEANQYAGWQTYTDTKYGISFKYPVGWTQKNYPATCMSQNCTAKDAEYITFDDSQTKQVSGDGGMTRTVPVNSFYYQVDSKSDYPSLTQFITDLNDPTFPFPKASNWHQVTIDGKAAYNGKFAGTDGISNNEYVFATQDGHVVEFGEIIAAPYSPVQADLTIFPKVVNTLSF